MNFVTKGLKKLEKGISRMIPHQHSADKRAQAQAVKEQMDLYKEERDQLHKKNEELAEQKKTEQNKLHEQQIRALRSKYRRRGGFMNSNTGDEVKETLG